MNKTLNHIENYVQLHTAEMDDADYVGLMRALAAWATRQVESYESREDNEIDNPEEE